MSDRDGQPDREDPRPRSGLSNGKLGLILLGLLLAWFLLGIVYAIVSTVG